MRKSVLKSLIFVTLTFSTISIVAQTPQIMWSPDFIESKGDKVGSILHDDGSNVYVFVYMLLKGRKTMTPGIIKMDSTMNPVLRKDYSVSIPEKVDIYMMGMFYCDDKFIMLTYIKDPKTKGKAIYATTINPQTLEPIQSAVEIWKVTTGNSYIENAVGFILSDDSTHFVVTSDDQVTHKFCVFDGALNKINEQNDIIQYANPKIVMLQYLQANDGSMYFFTKQYIGKAGQEVAKGKDAKPNYTVSLMKYSPDKSKREFPVKIPDALVDNIYAKEDPVSKHLAIFVTYTDVDDNALLMKEYEFIKMNSTTGEIVTRMKHTFPSELIDQLDMMEPDFKSKNGVLGISKTFNIFDIKMTADGRIYLILEKDYYFDNQHWMQGLITFMHDKDGNRKWINYIPKNQMFTGPNSFAHPAITVFPDKLAIFYNDHDDILRADPIEKKSKAKIYNSRDVNTLMLVEVDNSGIMARRIFASSEKLGTPVMTTESVRGYNNRFLLYGSHLRKNSYKIGVYNFD